MNSYIKPHLLAAGLSVCWMLGTQAADPLIDTSHVLPGGTRCDHVIHLMYRHGVNNSVNRAPLNSILHSPFGSMVMPGQELGDLEVVQVNQVLHHDDACGPKIAVILRNNSVRNVCNFHVSAVALLGRICPTSPSATVKVPEIKCGETLEVMLTLPLEALAMGNRNGQVVGFQRLVVAIDSFDELVETNEANNLKAYDRSCLAIATPAVEQSVETVSGAEPGVVQDSATPPADAGDTAGGGPNPPPPAADALQSAIRMLSDQSDAVNTTSAP